MGRVGGRSLDPHEERRHEVERDAADRGELAQRSHHPVVILQRRESHPRKNVLLGDGVFVGRLAYVTQEDDLVIGAIV